MFSDYQNQIDSVTEQRNTKPTTILDSFNIVTQPAITKSIISTTITAKDGTDICTFPGFNVFQGMRFMPTFENPTTTMTVPIFENFIPNFGLKRSSREIQQFEKQQERNSDDIIARAIFNVSIYNDERDSLIAKWNYLQAIWGTGKVFYSNHEPPIDITPDNFLCRFKTITYNRKTEKDNKDGYVLIIFNKPYNEVRNQRQQIIQNLNEMFGNHSNLIISIEDLKEEDDKTHLIIYVDEISLINSNKSRRILATDISNYLNQMQFSMQLENMNIEYVIPILGLDENAINKYLEIPPKGIDLKIWNQAKLNNPNPKKYLPVPIIGFKQLQKRIEFQDKEAESHIIYLKKLDNDLFDLNRRHRINLVKVSELKCHLAIMNHKILKIVMKKERSKKMNVPLTVVEELIKNKLKNIHTNLTIPFLFKKRLEECVSDAIRIINSCAIDKDYLIEVNSILKIQERMTKFLVTAVERDVEVMNRIKAGITELICNHK